LSQKVGDIAKKIQTQDHWKYYKECGIMYKLEVPK
jgi:hypothetical protein